MIVYDFDGGQHKWPPPHYVPLENATEKSSLHLRARDLLRRKFGSIRIMEEVPLVGTHLRLDFYVHQHRIAVEVQGEQHFKLIPFFYDCKLQFLIAKANDRLKKDWCNLNEIHLIEFCYNEDEKEWLNKVEQLLKR